MNLSHDALRDLTALAELKSEGGSLERQFLQLKGYAIKGRLVGTSSLEGMRMPLQLRHIGGIYILYKVPLREVARGVAQERNEKHPA